MEGRLCCATCMDIRGERTWCDQCKAPGVHMDNVPLVELFLEALPAWRTTGMDRILEGFDRAEILAMMHMRGVSDTADAWSAIALMEGELARIRALGRKEKP